MWAMCSYMAAKEQIRAPVWPSKYGPIMTLASLAGVWPAAHEIAPHAQLHRVRMERNSVAGLGIRGTWNQIVELQVDLFALQG